MKYALFVICITFSGLLLANNGGSVYVAKLKTNVNWEGNNTGASRSSTFEIVIDGKYKKEVSSEKDARFVGLELGKKHSVKILLNGKALESFNFKFEDHPCDKLWLMYKEIYGTWSLRTTSFKCKR